MKRLLPALLAALVAFHAAPDARAAEPEALRPGVRLERMESTRGAVFEGVVIRSVSARTVTFTHKGGLASIPLRELSPEMQRRAGYDPAAAAKEEAAGGRARIAEVPKKTAAPAPRSGPGAKVKPGPQARYESVIQAFGGEPEIRPEVDLRANFIRLALGTKSQGRRPSCSVFAVVSAVEYLHAEQTGVPEKFSEEYLTWATMRTTRRTPPPIEAGGGPDTENGPPRDAGFSLEEVAQAIRGYGLPLLSAMPNQMGRRMEDIPEPSPDVVENARARRLVSIHPIPGRDITTAIGNIVIVLNAGIPVPVGIRWPHWRSIPPSGLLSAQKPMTGYFHAVTLVGYRCPTGRPGDIVFIFRNSWGPEWGANGYGQATQAYLREHLLAAAMIEVHDAR